MNDNTLAKVKGTGGIVYIFSDHIEISRKSITGFIEQGIKGSKSIYFKDIKAIEYKKPTMWANGYIQFITNMELAKNQSVGILGTKISAAKDPNAVILRAFKKEVIKNAELVYKISMEQWEKSKEPKPTSSPLSGPDEIVKYKKLLDEDIITKEEFEAKKKQILGI